MEAQRGPSCNCGSTSWRRRHAVNAGPLSGNMDPAACLEPVVPIYTVDIVDSYCTCISSFYSQHLALPTLDGESYFVLASDSSRRPLEAYESERKKNTETDTNPISEGEMDCPSCGNGLAERQGSASLLAQPKLLCSRYLVPRTRRLLSRAPQGSPAISLFTRHSRCCVVWRPCH